MSVHLFLLIHIPAFFCILQHPRRLSSDAGDAESGLFRQPGQVRLELSGQSTKDDPILKFIRPWEPVGGSGKLQLLQKKFPHFLFVHEGTQADATAYAAGDKLSSLTFGRCAPRSLPCRKQRKRTRQMCCRPGIRSAFSGRRKVLLRQGAACRPLM